MDPIYGKFENYVIFVISLHHDQSTGRLASAVLAVK